MRDEAHSPPCGRALVALTPPAAATQAPRPVGRGAGFLAHLIATARSLPQARERRRAEPAEAVAAYRATAARIRGQ